jgi:hypothetical protein
MVGFPHSFTGQNIDWDSAALYKTGYKMEFPHPYTGLDIR